MATSEQLDDSKKTAKTATWNTIATVISLIVSTLTITVISRIMPQSELGTAATFLANRNTLDIILVLAIYSYTNRGLVAHESDEHTLIASLTGYCIASVLLFSLISLPFKSAIQEFLSLDDFLFFWLSPSLLAYALFFIADYYCIYMNKTSLVSWIVIATGPISQILSIALILMAPSATHVGRVIGLDFAYFGISIALLVWLFRERRQIDKYRLTSYIKEGIRFTAPLIPHLFSQMILTQFDLTLISYLAGSDKSGIYSMAHTIGNLAFTVLTQIMCAWSPWVYRRLRDGNAEGVHKGSRYLILMGLWLSCGLVTISPEMVHLLLPPEYFPSITVVPALVFSMFLQFLFVFAYDLEYYNKKTSWIALVSTIAAITDVVLISILVPHYGYLSACLATCISYLVLFGGNFVLSGKLGMRKIYDVKVMIISIVFMGGFSFLGFMLQDEPIFRYLLMIGITLVLFALAKNFIFQLIRQRGKRA